jgi:N6-adenosine-specific RNA methylase IME4
VPICPLLSERLHLHKRKALYEKLHPQTKHGGDRKSKSSSKLENLKSFAADTAAKTGRARSGISREIARAANIVGIEEAIGTCLDNGEQLDALAKLPAESQQQLIARAKSGEEVDVKVAVMKERRIRREQELAEGTKAASTALGKKLYGVIYADPPWRYDNVPMGDVARQNEQHYPSMALDDIKALPVPAADDCVLFLWATVPLLPEAIEVMKAWGFTYKSASTWVKDKAGTGYWVRGVVEHLLIGRRGAVPAPAPGDQFPGVVEAPRLRHSQKPDIFAEHIERLFPNVPKLEMFARERREGWAAWGNEVAS